MIASWIPWKWLLRRAARRRGFVDPLAFLARMRQFAQPSEVQEPIELIRAGVHFHARGLINVKVLQNNLDWIWPFWVARQFDPNDPSFLPRAFSFSHVNLTHRNWTAVGLPDVGMFPVVDPRGLVTPHLDGWSLDWWYVPATGAPLLPARSPTAEQRLEFETGLEVVTTIQASGTRLETRVRVEPSRQPGGAPELILTASLHAREAGRLFLAVRPANPEGVSFVDSIAIEPAALRVNERTQVRFAKCPEQFWTSVYASGDVARQLAADADRAHPAPPGGTEAGVVAETVHCPAGLATAAAGWTAAAGDRLEVVARLELGDDPAPARRVEPPVMRTSGALWQAALEGVPGFSCPNAHWKFLHEAAMRTLVLLSPGEILPGPYTYRRFWYRDACLIMQALLALNLDARVARGMALFPLRQKRDGYFHSQEGEWDANGEVLWIVNRYEAWTGKRVDEPLLAACTKGAAWLVRKRATTAGGRHAGLLPPGFSAEHLGPNDYYYWDDFWGIAGLEAAAELYDRRGRPQDAARQRDEAAAFLAAVRQSIAAVPRAVAAHGIPASPYRRLDAGAIGSLVADYPLQIEGIDASLLGYTADWLWRHCRHQGGFFQDMIHSGVNAYLTLALAQTFLRRRDARYLGLIETVASLASPTGQWPEAVHPRTGGGCMGDGQHAWAAAEWIMMMRALFVREERDHLVIGSGIPEAWFETEDRLAYGPTPTRWGAVTVVLWQHDGGWWVELDARWRESAPRLLLRAPGFEPATLAADRRVMRLKPAGETRVLL